MNINELIHYGVKGMHWGIRRYQNYDGTLINPKQIRKDNRIAFEKGRDATIASEAHKMQIRSVEKQLNKEKKIIDKYGKDDKKAMKQFMKSQSELKALKTLEVYKEYTTKDAEEHCKELIKKYGNDKVNKISYDKEGNINEKIHNGEEYAAAFLLGAMPMVMLQTPVGFILVPPSKNTMARRLQNQVKD